MSVFILALFAYGGEYNETCLRAVREDQPIIIFVGHWAGYATPPKGSIWVEIGDSGLGWKRVAYMASYIYSKDTY